MTVTIVDEETPLLPPTVVVSQKRQATPLPKLQISIVLLLQLCEPIISQSIYPYINQLVSELDITGGDERKVGYYTGLIESLFFATEALTILQWSRLSDHIGRKPILLIGLVGSALSMLCFGLSRTFSTLVISRCLCGLLNGNIGVMKSVMGELTDPSNRAEGFALLPVVWSAGGTLGSLIGGSLSNPHKRFPTVFWNEFWEEYPYFLPSLVVSSFISVSVATTAIVFEETVPKHKRESLVCSETTLEDVLDRNVPLPLRQILVWPVIISVANYLTLAFLNIMLVALLPLFFATSVEIGGLGLSPPIIGYLWGGYGAATGIFSVLFFAKILRYIGEKRVFFFGMISFVPIFILMPITSICARMWGVGPLVWSLVMLQLSMMVLMDMSYGSIIMYVTASAPNKRSLGATNGLSQTTASIVRAVGPALSTSLFSYSVQHNILGGYGVYMLMTTLSLFALIIATFLPAQLWGDNYTSDNRF